MAEMRHQIAINTTPEKVYSALATQDGLQNWWTADTNADERAGGKAEFGFDRRGMVFRMMIENLEPGKSVLWSCHGDHPEWDGTIPRWDIARHDGMAVLRFSHSGWKSASEFYAMCNSTWGELMYRSKAIWRGKGRAPIGPSDESNGERHSCPL